MVAEENEQIEDQEGDEEQIEGLEDDEAGGGFGPKQIVLFIVLPLLVLIGVGAALYFMGFIGGGQEEVIEEVVSDDSSTGIFYDLPDVIVNLNTSGRKPRFLKISVSLELAKQEDQVLVEKILPRVLDHFQTYLRELREGDLRGSSGIYRLRLELLARVNAAMHPDKVRDILFREILVQ